jgi:hypothetical protein
MPDRRAPTKTENTDERTRRRQLVAAFGEKAVEAELLRRGWSTANANISVKNSADFDIFAQKHTPQTVINVRVKTCGTGVNSFAFGLRRGEEVKTTGLSKNDFTILVVKAKNHSADKFFILPTKILRRDLAKYRRIYLNTPKRDGTARLDSGRYDLRLASRKTKYAGAGFETKWNTYLNNWDILEVGTNETQVSKA